MKKSICAVAFAIGAGFAGSAMAAPTAFTDVQWAMPLNGTKADAVECALIKENVKLTASSNVTAAFSCNEVLNVIEVGACHAGGHRAGILCAMVDADGDPATPELVPNSQNCTVEQATAGVQADVPSYSAFVATSAGGTMTARSMDGRCTTGELTGLDFWTN